MTTIMRARDIFSGLNPEDEQAPDKIIEVRETRGLAAIVEGFERFFEIVTLFGETNESTYDKALKSIPDRSRYNPVEVEQFSLLLERYINRIPKCEMHGLYLSALINRGKDRRFTVHTGRPPSLLVYTGSLGYYNARKIITIEGDTGYSAGHYMSGGVIIVNGNAKSPGSGMTGGKLIINGDVEGDVGWGIRGGKIHLNGNYNIKDINLRADGSPYDGGKIYHKGKLIVKKRVRVG